MDVPQAPVLNWLSLNLRDSKPIQRIQSGFERFYMIINHKVDSETVKMKDYKQFLSRIQL